MVKALAQTEIAKVYAYVVKNIRLITLGGYAFGMITASAFMGLCLFVLSLMYTYGADPRNIGIVGAVLGGIMLAANIVLLAIAGSQRFWIKTFKLDKVVEDAVDATDQAAHEGRTLTHQPV
jgi:hypothetical protein